MPVDCIARVIDTAKTFVICRQANGPDGNDKSFTGLRISK